MEGINQYTVNYLLPNSDPYLFQMHNEKWIGNIFSAYLWALIFQWDERSKVHEEQKKNHEVPWGQVSLLLLVTGICVD